MITFGNATEIQSIIFNCHNLFVKKLVDIFA